MPRATQILSGVTYSALPDNSFSNRMFRQLMNSGLQAVHVFSKVNSRRK